MLTIWFIVWWINGFPSVEFSTPTGADSWAIWLVICAALDIYGSSRL